MRLGSGSPVGWGQVDEVCGLRLLIPCNLAPGSSALHASAMNLSRASGSFGAIGFLLARPHHWWCVFMPMVITFVLLILVTWWMYSLGLEDYLMQYAPRQDTILGEWWADLSTGVGFILTLLASVLATWLLAGLVAGPFCDILGERIERELLADRPDLLAPPLPLHISILHSIRETVRRALLGALVLVAGFIMGIIPFIGLLLGPVASISSLVVFLSLDAFSYPLDRRSTPLRRKLAFIRANKSDIVPMALGLIPFALVPCCSVLVVPPLAATSARCRRSERSRR